MSRGEDWDEEPRERRRPPPDDYYEDEEDYDRDYERRRGRGYGERSGAVTGVAIINFVVGGLVMLFGLCMVIGVLFLAGEGGRAGAFNFPGMGGMMAIMVVITIAVLGWAIGAIVAGIGVVNRRQWARILTLVLAGIAGLAAIYFLISGLVALATPMPAIPGAAGSKALGFIFALLIALVLFMHCIWSFVVLLNSRYGEEFG